MKKRDFIIYNLIFLICVVVTVEIVNYQLTGNHTISGSNDSRQKVEKSLSDGKCGDRPLKPRPETEDPQLLVLNEYEQACQSAFIDDMMIFTNMPVSIDTANKSADKMTLRLKEFKSQAIKPIVIAEPDSDWGLIDFHEFATGVYDQWIDTYFARLKSNGVTDDEMGIWIPFPEPQQEFWNNNKNPDDFANSVNSYFTKLRHYFPSSQTAILLDSQVGEEDQSSQLLAYTRLVDNKLVDIAGLQGFPWHPTKEGDVRRPVTSGAQFVPADLLRDVAESLGTKKVLFNVGTYRHRKTNNGGDMAIPTAERQHSLQTIYDQAKTLAEEDYEVTVNIFAENKFDAKEGVDWSYWEPGAYATSEQKPLFTNFVSQLTASGVKISIFDARDPK